MYLTSARSCQNEEHYISKMQVSLRRANKAFQEQSIRQSLTKSITFLVSNLERVALRAAKLSVFAKGWFQWILGGLPALHRQTIDPESRTRR